MQVGRTFGDTIAVHAKQTLGHRGNDRNKVFSLSSIYLRSLSLADVCPYLQVKRHPDLPQL